jgi:hypothetical protein
MSRIKEIISRYKIHRTKEYNQFVVYEKYHSPSSNERMARVERSISRCNLLALRPLWVTEKMEVIHGRHRLTAAKSREKWVYYMIRSTSDEYHAWIKTTYGEEISDQ